MGTQKKKGKHEEEEEELTEEEAKKAEEAAQERRASRATGLFFISISLVGILVLLSSQSPNGLRFFFETPVGPVQEQVVAYPAATMLPTSVPTATQVPTTTQTPTVTPNPTLEMLFEQSRQALEAKADRMVSVLSIGPKLALYIVLLLLAASTILGFASGQSRVPRPIINLGRWIGLVLAVLWANLYYWISLPAEILIQRSLFAAVVQAVFFFLLYRRSTNAGHRR